MWRQAKRKSVVVTRYVSGVLIGVFGEHIGNPKVENSEHDLAGIPTNPHPLHTVYEFESLSLT